MAAAALVVVLAAGAAVGAGVSGADAAKARVANMKSLGGAGKAIGDQLKSGSPDAAVVKTQAARMVELANAMPTWFPKGSGPESGAKTRALPLIWSDPAGFSAAQKGFAAQVTKLNALAAAGDMAAVGGQMNAVGAACKTCHDKFRGPET
ncbi:MAG TPA: cytochrome c [Caulobacteraceae bacterium]|nr:cytochrome c [Caulobacteraceae bacterium]